MSELKKDTWYWMYNPEEGDIFHPIFVRSDGAFNSDGVKHTNVKPESLPLTEAVMPDFEGCEISPEDIVSGANDYLMKNGLSYFSNASQVKNCSRMLADYMKSLK